MRQTLGSWCVGDEEEVYDFCSDHLQEHSKRLFSTVPRAYFTVFRCLTEGCASVDGTPLLVHVMESSWTGTFLSCFYFIVYICVVLGVFNIITGILVEKTIASAKLGQKILEEDKRQKLQHNS